MQHGSFLWWMAISGMVVTGAAVPIMCCQVAACYRQRLQAGANPDALALGRAVSDAVRTAFAPIICSYHPARSAGGRWFAPLAGAVISPVLFMRADGGFAAVVLCAAFMILALLAWIDAQTGLLPDALTLPLLWGGLALAWVGGGIPLHASVAGAMAGYGVPAAINLSWQLWRQCNGMGAGDLKLLAAVGAWCGPDGVAAALLLASMAGVAFAVVHQRRLMPRGSYPFGPFICVAAMAVMAPDSAVQSWFWA